MAAYPGSAVPPELLHEGLWVAEVVYMPIETAAAQGRPRARVPDARRRGMVALQAAGSMELITGVRPDRDRMLRHVERADRRRQAGG